MGMLTRAHEYAHVLSGTTVLDELTPGDRLLIAGRAFFFYPWKILFPTDLAFIYERWDVRPGAAWQWLFPLAGLALAVVVLARWRAGRLARGAVAALLFYAVTIFPALGFVNVAPMRFSFTTTGSEKICTSTSEPSFRVRTSVTWIRSPLAARSL